MNVYPGGVFMAIRDKNYMYEVESWQGLIQHILFLASRDYTRIHVTYYPVEKQDRWKSIDEKLYKRYHTNLTRGQVDYRRKQGYKVYKFFRYDQTMILMSTEGKDYPEIEEQDKFQDLKTAKQKIQVTSNLYFEFYYSGQKKKYKRKQKNGIEKRQVNFTVRMGKETIEYWKLNLRYHIKLKHKKDVFREIRKIAHIPSFSGIYEQKVQLRKFILNEIKKHGLKLTNE